MATALNFNTQTEAVVVTSLTAGSGADVLFECPANYDAVVTWLSVSNSQAATANISVQFYHAEDTTYHHLVENQKVIGNAVNKIISEESIYLHSGDKIVLYKYDGATDLEAIISCKKFYNPKR